MLFLAPVFSGPSGSVHAAGAVRGVARGFGAALGKPDGPAFLGHRTGLSRSRAAGTAIACGDGLWLGAVDVAVLAVAAHDRGGRCRRNLFPARLHRGVRAADQRAGGAFDRAVAGACAAQPWRLLADHRHHAGGRRGHAFAADRDRAGRDPADRRGDPVALPQGVPPALAPDPFGDDAGLDRAAAGRDHQRLLRAVLRP